VEIEAKAGGKLGVVPAFFQPLSQQHDSAARKKRKTYTHMHLLEVLVAAAIPPTNG
jgi:hypothetical protein